jgi:uncharacterized coiled-coil DUF342 family protein
MTMHEIDLTRLSSLSQSRDSLQAAARKANDTVNDLHRNRCAVICEIDSLKSSQPRSLNSADDKQKVLTFLASKRDALTVQIREARAVKDEADEKALAAVQLIEE